MRIETDIFEKGKELGLINSQIQTINSDLKQDRKELEIFWVYKNFVEEIIGMKFEGEVEQIQEQNKLVV